MPERPGSSDAEVYSNPLPPSLQQEEYDDDSGAQPLTNADFRKLLMTPRVPSTSSHTTHKPAAADVTEEGKDGEKGEERKKKKSYYAKLKKDEEERQRELAQRYRDRAQERRVGQNKDYEQTELVSTTADYRAVAPDAKAGETYAERRKQVIQESKFLGGDMEHTHLVKGLDYALLEKVRAEITNKEQEELEMEWVVQSTNTKPSKDAPAAAEKEEDPEEHIQFKTKMARNIYRSVFKSRIQERSELFLPKRMAYVVELDDEFGESDIPTTLIRSKADCPTLEATTTLSTNDIVIQKLTQILSYLRQGKRDKKAKKKEKGKIKEEEKPKVTEESIYTELGDYNPNFNKSKDRDRDRGTSDRDRKDRERGRGDRDRDRDRGRGDRDRDRDRDRHSRFDRDRDHDRDRDRDRGRERDREDDREKKRSYFEKPADEDEGPQDQVPASAKELVQSINDRFSSSKQWGNVDLGPDAGFREPEAKPKTKEDERMKKLKNKMNVDSYAECYPGMMESADAIDDSDDEVDFTKMDQGNKKGPVGRWDFETQEEYSNYMSQKEALPKAAFQYGVKMADGRKTRRTGPKDDKKELDREWQKIQNIIQKRKQAGNDEGPYAKSAKY